MLRIAVCDDETIWQNNAHNIVYDYFNNRSIEVQIDKFDNAERLLNMLLVKKETIDILILDIDMPSINGFEAAEKIKRIYPDIILLFYTSHEHYVFEAFKFQPFRYVRKTYVETELNLALDAAWQVIESNNEKSITLKSPDETLNIKISEIVYFETNKRRCDVHLRNGKIINVRKTIKELYSEINSRHFIMIHNGAVVNVQYIKSYSTFDITLEDDTRLIVSRSNIKSVKTAITKYWGSKI